MLLCNVNKAAFSFQVGCKRRFKQSLWQTRFYL